jgi:hypothetical protein
MTQTDEILNSLGSASWWFSTVVVAIIANVGANYLYDFLKPRMKGRWSTTLELALVVTHFLLFAVAILAFAHLEKYNLSLLLLLIGGLTAYESYLTPGSGLSLILSVLAVFGFT